MDVAITKMSSKGQVVIPAELRQNLKEGDKLIIIKNRDQLIMKKTTDLNLSSDLKFAERTEAALKRVRTGKGKRLEFNEFIKEMKKW